MSAWAALMERAHLQADETVLVLVNGATGTVRRLAVQIVKYLGASKVIAAGRDVKALEEIRGLGADSIIPFDSMKPLSKNCSRRGSTLSAFLLAKCAVGSECRHYCRSNRLNQWLAVLARHKESHFLFNFRDRDRSQISFAQLLIYLGQFHLLECGPLSDTFFETLAGFFVDGNRL
jgi:D-arabinose 1-dehydrogenase-like Zn-dependent alcohol dehydrogenase